MGIEIRVVVHQQTRDIMKRKLVRAAVHQTIADRWRRAGKRRTTQLEYLGLTFLPVAFSYAPRMPSVCMCVSKSSNPNCAQYTARCAIYYVRSSRSSHGHSRPSGPARRQTSSRQPRTPCQGSPADQQQPRCCLGCSF